MPPAELEVAATTVNRQWVLADRPIGRAVREGDFRLVESPLPMPGRGEILDHALGALNRYGRVVCCGRIAGYLKTEEESYRLRNWHVIGKQRAKMQGFFIYDLAEHFPRAERQMAQWIADGRMQYLEDVLEGFGQVPRAPMRLYEGHNRGKQIVRVDPVAR